MRTADPHFTTQLLLAATLALAGLLALAGPAAADGSPPTGHPHGPHGGAADVGGASSDEEKGPNLQLPAELPADVRADLEAAIDRWDAAVALLQKSGPAAARRAIDEAIAALEAVRPRGFRTGLPEYYLGIGYQLLGLYYGEEREYERALTRLRAAVRFRPEFHEAWVELGDTFGHLARPRDAEGAYDRAIETAPDEGHAYLRRAILHVQQGRLEQAQADIVRARELDPEDAALAGVERQLRLVLEGPEWTGGVEVQTRNYIIRTNVSQEFGEMIGKHAELVRRLYTQVFPDPPRTRRKYPIVVFKDKAEYHRNGGPQGAGGHFDPTFKQLFLFQYPKESDTLLVLYHEGFHQFLDSVLDTKPPQWFNEGVADYFGPSEHVSEGGVEGMRIRPNPWRLDLVKRMVQTGRTTPFETLMNMTQREMYGADAGLHYAQSWAMIYFFCEADDRAHMGYLKRYFTALRRGRSQREAYELAFGRADMQAIEQRWREFILRVR